jgi:hypothetical protein
MIVKDIKENADMVKGKSSKGVCSNTGRTHFKKGFTPWNKGLTKDTNAIVAQIGQKNKDKLTGRVNQKRHGWSEFMRKVNPPHNEKYTTDGYKWIFKPDYPGASKSKLTLGRIYEHRYVLEQTLGRYLTSTEQVHHLDGIKNHNVIDNLLLCANISEHTLIHQQECRFVEKLIREGKAYYDRATGEFKLR